MVKVAVLGAGVIGLSCAVKIQEEFKDIQVVLISDEFSPDTTGDGSGGLWYPYLCGKTPGNLLKNWAHETYILLHKLWLTGGHDVCAIPMYYLDRDNEETDWAATAFGYHKLNLAQLEYFSRRYSATYVAGHTMLVFVIPPIKLMAYLHKRFEDEKGEIIRARLNSLQDPRLAEFDVIVNCTGIGARQLGPDEQVFSIRGQVAKVDAAWYNDCVMDMDRGNYIIPNSENCVLGGTHQDNDYSTAVDDADTQFILDGCRAMVPALKDAKLLNSWAGLRPGRIAVRLEPEEREGKLYVHNYGHGGSGLSLFWGCASDVLGIIKSHLNKTQSNTQSKL